MTADSNIRTWLVDSNIRTWLVDSNIRTWDSIYRGW
jgi:hypothetical protein